MENLYQNTSPVVSLSMFDFDGDRLIKFHNRQKKKPKQGIIIFYTPWCKGCIHMKDRIEDIATQFSDRFIITAVNCEHPLNYGLKQRFGIKRYPTIKYFDAKGDIETYTGPVDRDHILSLITSHL